MNRKERRATTKRSQTGAGSPDSAQTAQLFAEAVRHYQLGQGFDAEALCRRVLARDAGHAGGLHLLGVIAMQRGLFDEAVGYLSRAAEARPDIAVGHHNLGKALAAVIRPDAAAAAFERAVALQPDFAEAHKDLGIMLMALGRFREASAHFARSLALVPQLAENFSETVSTLLRVNPALGEGVARTAAAWPKRVPADQLLDVAGWAAIADDPMLLGVLTTTPVRDLALERFLTSVRAALLERAASSHDADPRLLEFCCAVARQCFNNEYVFTEGQDESDLVERQSKLLADAIEGAAEISPLRLAAVASYRPLATLLNVGKLLERAWPEAVDKLLAQQVREVDEERRIRATIPQLTPIEGETTAAVRRQYEENPYPRWVMAPSQPEPGAVDDHFKSAFPLSRFRPLGHRTGVDILVAGCGSGEHSIVTARRYRGARVLAIDLSLSSLAYAQRKTRELGLSNIEYAQADVLALGSIGRSFDVIEASGVLHHLSDPAAGWRELLKLLRPGGLMRVGLYSELARVDIVAGRQFIAEHGFDPTAAGIRRCRQEVLAPLPALARFPDFFSISGCRDLLFHVQEHRFTIPRIKEFLDEERLVFLGFELQPATSRDYRLSVPDDRAMTDLECWDTFERERPNTFAGMYQFWCQRG
jgi:2-polyprenyl-3-methyl-5-hydroxy-6-metoxy-1,4-benzoquinol methylase/cytochrome c-type biogenesis protein CcmH/NrfG